MIIGCCFTCVFAVLINKVSLEETVKADIGGSVVLPCSSTEHDLKPQDTDVHWRHNGSEIVCDIIKGESSVEQQDPQYKNRVETFPDEYLRGNFSIKLNSLQYTDAGEFSCLISHSSEHQTIQLSIKESTAKKESKSAEQENQEDTEADSMDTSSNWVFILLAVLLLFILSVASFIICYCRKKIRLPHSLLPGLKTKNSDTKDISCNKVSNFTSSHYFYSCHWVFLVLMLMFCALIYLLYALFLLNEILKH